MDTPHMDSLTHEPIHLLTKASTHSIPLAGPSSQTHVEIPFQVLCFPAVGPGIRNLGTVPEQTAKEAGSSNLENSLNKSLRSFRSPFFCRRERLNPGKNLLPSSIQPCVAPSPRALD